MKRLYFLICAFGLILFNAALSQATLFDHFEDSVIDSNLWSVGGARRGWNPNNQSDVGNWEFGQEEFYGSLQLSVSGPQSANTYGAESWLQTKYDFNDGRSHSLNFTWSPDFDDPHYNYFYIQLTDGFVSPVNTLHWSVSDYPETVNLYRHPFENQASPGVLEWHVDIRQPEIPGKKPTVTLSDESGDIVFYQSLDVKNEQGDHIPWHLRFMVSDGTSAGFPGGGAQLSLYDFSRSDAWSKYYDLSSYLGQAFIEDSAGILAYLYLGEASEWLTQIAQLAFSEDYWGFDSTEFNRILNDPGPSGIGTNQPVPEPSTILLLGCGLVGLVRFSRKKVCK